MNLFIYYERNNVDNMERERERGLGKYFEIVIIVCLDMFNNRIIDCFYCSL